METYIVEIKQTVNRRMANSRSSWYAFTDPMPKAEAEEVMAQILRDQPMPRTDIRVSAL